MFKTAPSKSDETRGRILGAALDLFQRKGFEQTTMREIAAGAGVATGAAYYYFASKDAIVLAFYDRSQREMAPLLEKALAGNRNLQQRLRALLQVKLNYFEPNRGLLGTLASHIDPGHPLSPFSDATRDTRGRDIEFFERALSGSRTPVAEDLGRYLPRLLWLYQMGIILFWIYDRSSGQKRTEALVDQSLSIIVRLIRIAGFPLMRPLRRMAVNLAETVMDTPGA